MDEFKNNAGVRNGLLITKFIRFDHSIVSAKLRKRFRPLCNGLN